jgi:hypothetical protein
MLFIIPLFKLICSKYFHNLNTERRYLPLYVLKETRLSPYFYAAIGAKVVGSSSSFTGQPTILKGLLLLPEAIPQPGEGCRVQRGSDRVQRGS